MHRKGARGKGGVEGVEDGSDERRMDEGMVKMERKM